MATTVLVWDAMGNYGHDAEGRPMVAGFLGWVPLDRAAAPGVDPRLLFRAWVAAREDAILTARARRSLHTLPPA